jgi:hypothetical protein
MFHYILVQQECGRLSNTQIIEHYPVFYVNADYYCILAAIQIICYFLGGGRLAKLSQFYWYNC